MEKSVLDITDILRHQKQGLTTSYVKDIEGRAQNIDSYFFYTKLPLNEDDKNFEEQLSYMNYNKTVKNYMILVGKVFISLLLMFLCLVINVVCLSIHNSMIKNYNIINWYHVHFWGVLRVVMEKDYKIKINVRLGRWICKFSGSIFKQWQKQILSNFGKWLRSYKEKIPSQCRIG